MKNCNNTSYVTFNWNYSRYCICKLHNTTIGYYVIEGSLTTLRLDNGGYETPTTKKRMNEFLDEIGRPYRVVQRKGIWELWNYKKNDIVARFKEDGTINIIR